MSWYDNMSRKDDPEIIHYVGEDYTSVTFQPDYKRFNMKKLDDDTLSLLRKRVLMI